MIAKSYILKYYPWPTHQSDFSFDFHIFLLSNILILSYLLLDLYDDGTGDDDKTGKKKKGGKAGGGGIVASPKPKKKKRLSSPAPSPPHSDADNSDVDPNGFKISAGEWVWLAHTNLTG